MRSIATDLGFVQRLCKAVLVGVVAVIMTFIALGNVTNYDANWPFVRHVLAMDTIFPDSHVQWRAIRDPALASAAYWGIIGWEILCAATTAAATIRLLIHAGNGQHFARALPLALLGLALVAILFGVVFLAIGGEWFLMWQSARWNGTESAMRYFTLASLAILVALTPDGAKDGP